MTVLSEADKALLDAPEYATVATIDPDGQPQLSVVWVGRDGDDVLFSTLKGRRKTRNLERDPRASVLIFPREDPYHYLELRGTVSMVEDPTAAYIDEMALKYTGVARFDGPREGRIVVRLTPHHVVTH
ncbi:MAG: PPOX class F420-dependent oxidoreductase [Kineosporiaceae bacterium]|nr:PPOX class F420-dependent oxidoreductase [Kineosporiaceae bacterium]